MPEPHTHGGTDAPECTTCRPTNDRALAEALKTLVRAGVLDVEYRFTPDGWDQERRYVTRWENVDVD